MHYPQLFQTGAVTQTFILLRRGQLRPDYPFIITKDDLILTSKLNEWNIEDEYRLIINNNLKSERDRLLDYDISCISGVIFGSNMAHQNLRTIDTILFEKNKHLPTYFALKNPDRDSLIFNLFQY